MSTGKNISELYEKQNHSLIKHVRSARDLKPDHIHKLRIDIKRIRSFFKLLKTFTGKKGPSKSLLKLLHPVFSGAGKAREATQNIDLLGNAKSPITSDFKKYLRKREKKKEKTFKGELKYFDFKKYKALNKDLIKNLKTQETEHVRRKAEIYLNSLNKEIRSFAPATGDDDTFHKIRKRMKDMKMIAQLLETVSGKPVKRKPGKSEIIEEKIGDWHDNIVLVEAIAKYLDKHDDEHSADLILMALQVQAKNEEYKKEIAAELVDQ
jgi:CHAD domain-containing protein